MVVVVVDLVAFLPSSRTVCYTCQRFGWVGLHRGSAQRYVSPLVIQGELMSIKLRRLRVQTGAEYHRVFCCNVTPLVTQPDIAGCRRNTLVRAGREPLGQQYLAAFRALSPFVSFNTVYVKRGPGHTDSDNEIITSSIKLSLKLY